MKIDEQMLLFCSLDPISEDDDNLDRPGVTVNKWYLEGLGILLC